MTVLNIRLNKITGERKDKKKDIADVTANANSTISSVKIMKNDSVGKYLLVNFKYRVGYEPDIGGIELEGSLWFLHPALDKMVKDGKEKIELKKEAVEEVSTAVIRESLIESVNIARKLGLPLPIQLPKVDVKPDEIKFKKAS